MSSTTLAPAPRGLVPERLTGRTKAAVLLMALGPEASATLLRDLPQEEIEAITAEIARLDDVPGEVVQAVLEEWEASQELADRFASGGIGYARKLLQQTVGPQKAEALLRKIEGRPEDEGAFSALRDVDPSQLAALIAGEHPQTIALILASLDPASTAPVLKELPSTLAGEVLFRIARMDKVRPDVLDVVAEALRGQTGVSLSREPLSSMGGPAAVAALLNLVPNTLETELLGQISARSPDLSEEIQNLMFVFEDLIKLDDGSIQKVLREVEVKELALALKGASDELKQKILGTMSQRAVKALQEEMEFLGPVRLRDVEVAQAAIVKAARDLEAQGEIVLDGAADDLIH